MHSMLETFATVAACLSFGCFYLSLFFLIVGGILAIKRWVLKKQTKLSTSFLLALGFFIAGAIFILTACLTGVVPV
jgi:hypothetical protein